ncbi:MAG TPA: hypothetical protein VFS43_03765 [Polyangiaceae bacterium]|nr:hypothetical protein [Polyangiaceae bacterium]
MRLSSIALCVFALTPAALGCAAQPRPEAGPAEGAPGEARAALGADEARARAALGADEARARAALMATAASACLPTNQACVVSKLRRTPLRDDIVEYSFELKVGPGEFDRIGLHRVARETAPYRPAAAATGVFLVHGDVWPFNPMFVGGPPKAPAPRAESAAIYFAERGIDVWGIDRRWVQSPAATTDFTFMRDWTLDVQLQDLGVGLGVARALRALTGSGAGPVHLLGFSRGAALTYAYANAEAQVPPALRQIKGLVPVDYAYKFDPADAVNGASACQLYRDSVALFEQGGLSGYALQIYADIGALAATDPRGASPFVPALTNENFAVAIFTREPGDPGPFTPFFHNFGARRVLGPDFETLYTDEAEYFDVLQSVAAVESFREEVDTSAISCDEVDTPYDDHLGAITVPTFYVGAKGGFGDTALYTLGLLGSADKSSLFVGELPAGEELLDWGHQDLFTAAGATELVFRPIADWLLAH